LATGEEMTTSIDWLRQSGDPGTADDLGGVVWSPDGESLLLTASFGGCVPVEERLHSIVRVNFNTSSHSILVDRSSQGFLPKEWPTPEQALLQDSAGNQWWMNTSTGELTPD
jgi:hypothetical protein